MVRLIFARRCFALLVVVVASRIPTSRGQTCETSTISEVIFSDLTVRNSAFTSSISTAGDTVIDATDTTLTSTAANSYGGFFFNSATDFQGPGGFSLKFVIQSTNTAVGNGDAWEAIVAGSSNLDLLPPPYAAGSTNEGLSGWSRLNALVVELDSLNSGGTEQDASANHVAVYLAGTEVCNQDLSFSLASGDAYTIWIDYNGFSTAAEIRISAANDSARPASSIMTCIVDIWGTLDISASNHIGFMAYNPSSGGAEHSLVDSISVADAYRPYDTDDCAAYAKCSQRGAEALCLTPESSNDCSLAACVAAFVWDVSGSQCCAFIEKGTWLISDAAGTGPFADGDVVDCEQTRRTVAYLTSPDNCP